MSSGVETFYLLLAVVGVTAVGLSATSGLFRYEIWVSEPAVAVVVGVLIGPFVGNWLPIHVGPESLATTLLTESARLTLAVAILGAALRLPNHFVRRHARELGVILGVGMVGMWLVSASLASLFFVELSAAAALLLGAMLAPTDPVLATPIITGKVAEKHVPPEVGDLINMESGSNDGAALALVLLPAEFLRHSQTGEAFDAWLFQGLLWEVGVGIVIGVAFGLMAGAIKRWTDRQPWSESESLLPLALAVILTVVGVGRVMHTDSLLACFVAGLFLRFHFQDRCEEQQLSFRRGVGRFFDVVFFVLLGAALPFGAWSEQLPTLFFFALAILLLRRLPLWILLRHFLPSLKTTREAALTGWFGPIGASTVFYALLESSQKDMPNLWPIASFVVVASILAHGVSSTPLSRHAFKLRE